MIGNNGRGSTQQSTRGNVVFTDDIPNLSNDQRLPVMVTMTASNGCFAMLNASRPLAEDMILPVGAGAVAAFASTGMRPGV